jgi:hypothetical protein
MDYGQWAEPVSHGVVQNVPLNNSCYKRALLLELGDELEAGMVFEPRLHDALRRRGHGIYLEPAARLSHLNVSLIAPWIGERYAFGRWVGGDRASRWSTGRRFAYAGAAPLIAIVHLSRILRNTRRPLREHRLLPRVLPALTAAVVVRTVGELVGFVFGPGDAARRTVPYELHKVDYVTGADRKDLTGHLASASDFSPGDAAPVHPIRPMPADPTRP